MKRSGKVLVTGGAGYIGSVLVRVLLSRGWQIRCLDRLDYGRESLTDCEQHESFELLVGDICNQSDLKDALEDITAVVHLAAIVGEPACNANPAETRDVNTRGSEMLCTLALAAGVHRFLFASTCSNYGSLSREDNLVDETAELQPLSVYSQTKVGFEKYLLGIKQDRFCPTVLRFATAYGLSPRPRFDLTLNEFTKELLLNRQLEVYGEDFWRPYCHTEDIAAACAKVLEAEESQVSHQAFNVGSTEENYQKKSLVAMIDQELPGASELVIRVDREVDPRDYRVSFEKIKGVLDFETSKEVPEGIREIIRAIRSGRIGDPDSRQYRNA